MNAKQSILCNSWNKAIRIVDIMLYKGWFEQIQYKMEKKMCFTDVQFNQTGNSCHIPLSFVGLHNNQIINKIAHLDEAIERLNSDSLEISMHARVARLNGSS